MLKQAFASIKAWKAVKSQWQLLAFAYPKSDIALFSGEGFVFFGYQPKARLGFLGWLYAKTKGWIADRSLKRQRFGSIVFAY